MKHDTWLSNLIKDRDVLLAFPSIFAEHRKRVRTPPPVAHAFAILRQSAGKPKECLSRKTGRAMVVKLMKRARAKLPKLHLSNRMPEILQGIACTDGVETLQTAV